MSDYNLILLRGVSGGGKSTLAEIISPKYNVAADDFFVGDDGVYRFNPRMLSNAHDWCKKTTEYWMNSWVPKIVVHNTFSAEWEMEAYFNLASEYGYMIHTMVVENRHQSKDVHGVPEHAKEKMANNIMDNLILR